MGKLQFSVVDVCAKDKPGHRAGPHHLSVAVSQAAASATLSVGEGVPHA